MIVERDVIFSQRDVIVKERDTAIIERDTIIIEIDTLIYERDNSIASITKREAMIIMRYDERGIAIMVRDASIMERV